MELRTYWNIIWRRFWIVALVVVAVGLYSGYQYYQLRKAPGALKTNHSQVTLKIGLQGNMTNDHNYVDYISAAESLADEYANGPVLSSPEFDKQVIEQIRGNMSQVTQRFGANPDLGDWTNPGAIGGALSAGRAHSQVTVNVTWLTGAGAWAIAKAVGEVTVAHINTYFDYTVSAQIPGTTGLQLPVVAARVTSDAADPSTIAGPSSNKPTLLLAFVFIGLLIGLALAFLVEYLDDRIRGKDDALRLLQLPIYGEVPRAPSVGPNRPGRSSAA